MKDTQKPNLSVWQIWNMCFGFFGIQYGFGLQQANLSTLFRFHGAAEHELPILWLAGPVTGLLIQPLIGALSDRTWTRFGRRRPYFMVGALVASIAVLFMPHVPELWMVIGLFWILDAAINTSVEPYRALIGDSLTHEQRPLGYGIQSIMVAVGQMLAGVMPIILIAIGVSSETDGKSIPDIVTYSFLIGVVTILIATTWSFFNTVEYPPSAQQLVEHSRTGKGIKGAFADLWHAVFDLPVILREIWWVKLFVWYGLPLMWQFLALSIARHCFDAPTPDSPGFVEGTAQVGIAFTVMNVTTVLVSFLLPKLVYRVGESITFAVALTIGGLGFISMQFTDDLFLTLALMVPVGVAWASIITVPYVITSNAVPPHRVGVYMGILNAFVCIPQIFMMVTVGTFYDSLLLGDPRNALALCGVCFIIGALLALRIKSISNQQPFSDKELEKT